VRAVVDTNVWVSAFLNATGFPARVLEAYAEGRFILVISEPLLEALRSEGQQPSG
jgi:predicted nucleic acid-binding protein